MKAFNRLLAAVIIVSVIILLAVNVYVLNIESAGGRQYRVDAARAAARISENGYESVDISDYPSLISIEYLGKNCDDIGDSRYDNIIRVVDGEIYRFNYSGIDADYRKSTLAAVNISLGVMFAVIISVVLYIKLRVLKPFVTLSNVPYELSKGNLTVPLKENKHKIFGRFVWGMDMLRENIEQHKSNELHLQSEKKKLILSVSHDIRIPLSAIKMYSKALSHKLYDGEEKQREIAESINAKADEIESFVAQIIKASNEDFLDLRVNNGEFYMSELIDKISDYYSDKLKLLKIDFDVEKYRNCLLRGDIDRAVEVLQNIIENAVKYGDGKYIKISFSDEEDCRLITVENSGCTLQQSEMPHIFDSFWRGSNAREGDGSGLGLYICRNLMTKMNGDIFAKCSGEIMEITAVFARA